MSSYLRFISAVTFAVISTLIAVLIAAQNAFAAKELTPDEIVEKADEGRMPFPEMSFLAIAKDFEKGKLAHETRYQVLNKGREASLVTTIFPERQKDRKLLMKGNDLWLYTPDIKRAARVSMQQKLTGEISNGDLARTNYSGDYDAKLIGMETIKGKKAYHLDLKSKHSGVTYSRIEYWVQKDDHLPIKAVFYAVSGKVLKTGQYLDATDVLGKKCITKLHIIDALNTDRQSVLTYTKHKRVKISESDFNKERLGDD